MVVTLNSQYYRLIDLPEASFGLIGSGLAVIGIFIPRISLSLTRRFTPAINATILAVFSFLALGGMSFFIPRAGLLPVVMVYGVISMNGFFVSHYLNRITDSSRRATVLSFKGLAMNLAYGLIGMLYSLLVGHLRSHTPASQFGQNSERIVFIQAFGWFPWYFLILTVLFLAFSSWRLKDSESRNGLAL
jgi:hypothetical protein